MTAREMQSAFELEVNRYDSSLLVESHIIFYWLNDAQDRYVKTRYSGYNLKGESFEQTQKRTDDLRALVEQVTISTNAGGVQNKPNSYLSILPNDYFISLEEEATISFIDSQSTSVTRRVGVKETTSDTYRALLDSPYSEHRLHYETAKPLRLFIGNSIEAISDGNYTVDAIHLRYLRLPTPMQFTTSSENSCELPEHTHAEIVSTAINTFLLSIDEAREESIKPEYLVKE